MERPRAPSPPSEPPRAGRAVSPSTAEIDVVLIAALVEDLGLDPAEPWDPRVALERDLSTAASVDPETRGLARLVSKGSGVVCGLAAFARAFELLDPGARCELRVEDGAGVEPGTLVATVSARARALLTAERTALNLVQRLSGTATAMADLVARAATGGPARLLDTRKTTPGLRLLEKYAVRCGGGENHRFGLFDEVMLKDNHLDLARAAEGLDMGQLVARVRARVGGEVRITAEARDRAEAESALRGGADVLLLDNQSPQELSELCPRLRALATELGRRVELEASGGIDASTVAAYAACGVDRLSVGAPTHSAPALDLSLRLEVAP
ncbi:Nicotinate-nucleotide pyrophosphorylase [carboxylating] [Planctomycetes bacterium Pla86]|uniref:nicotinate-nucleotide diphosphorylase (carboxylating) n=2 Tax=Engelhardtia mirabilis TaxID=2528011 RepID=A0A518BH46_9BACT|nr:Nicotinate-nucleotide pyrophosphorylase [carboxylating] [Planctomycetes bacterium Pla133]QDV00628.1 Nicotinate-nucleotide pyrophosphorylase [carboxylating] [Planctomycetes bacterium Pla86]